MILRRTSRPRLPARPFLRCLRDSAGAPEAEGGHRGRLRLVLLLPPSSFSHAPVLSVRITTSSPDVVVAVACRSALLRSRLVIHCSHTSLSACARPALRKQPIHPPRPAQSNANSNVGSPSPIARPANHPLLPVVWNRVPCRPSLPRDRRAIAFEYPALSAQRLTATRSVRRARAHFTHRFAPGLGFHHHLAPFRPPGSVSHSGRSHQPR